MSFIYWYDHKVGVFLCALWLGESHSSQCCVMAESKLFSSVETTVSIYSNPSPPSHMGKCGAVLTILALMPLKSEVNLLPGLLAGCSPRYINYKLLLSIWFVIYHVSENSTHCFIGHSRRDFSVRFLYPYLVHENCSEFCYWSHLCCDDIV